jgi:hypothetical protein
MIEAACSVRVETLDWGESLGRRGASSETNLKRVGFVFSRVTPLQVFSVVHKKSRQRLLALVS